MTKFLILWELDTTRIPESPVKQMILFNRLMNMVDEDLKSGMLNWGESLNGHTGYVINEGTEEELALVLMRYTPYVKFKVHPVLSTSQVKENIKAL